MFAALAPKVAKDDPASAALDRTLEVRLWMRQNLADANAEMMGMSEPVQVGAEFFRVVRLRGKNGFGGPVINDYISRSNSAESVGWMESLREWRKLARYDKTLGVDGAEKVATSLGFTLE